MTLNKIIFCLLFLVISCSKQVKNQQLLEVIEADNWNDLIDKDLSKWDTYLSYQIQPGYDGSQPKNKKGELIPPIGLNKPGYDVFTTIQEGDNTIIKNTGEYYGCLITKGEFKNYHFQLKYKWGNKTWAYRKNLLKDSGILYHSTGPMAAEYWRSWMLSQEFQIMEGHTGDFWSQANSAIDIRAYKPESNLDPLAHESQDYLSITRHGPYGNYCMRSGNYEKAHGEWNTLDLYCFEGKSLHVVNGEVVMILKNSRYIDENGNSIPLIKGKIQLQSEAAELFFKDIRIREIDSLTPEQKALF
ncbi:3-keto-disaccharide hydrolase [Seonamhaeicola maritimus]|uniref:DUF1080 domain-containing protein n=1 Tax=Seonamhaeicola maritimus TaxID=2591822 RepID=A0A5C7GI91_9FLAO|nr:DUF1080 domain-containing protein [Seonamhaeicola maritimus]TXG37316.1 DUF1080 domain-containing protein [Seonamhaeicola maritimus]